MSSSPNNFVIPSGANLADNPDVFPVFPGLMYTVAKSPVFTTRTTSSASGRERRSQLRQYPLWETSLSAEFLRERQGYYELSRLYAFFCSHAGSYKEFFLRDGQMGPVSNFQFATGDGSARQFQITRPVYLAGNISFTDRVDGFLGDPTLYINGRMIATPVSRNILRYSEEMLGGPWSSNGGGSVTTDTDTAPDGMVSADTLSDTSATITVAPTYQVQPVTSDNSAWTFSVHIKKTTGATTFPAITADLYDGTPAQGRMAINTNTGQIVSWGSGTVGVVDAGTYWRVWMTITNNSTNAHAQLAIYPAWNTIAAGVGSTNNPAITGTCVAWGAQVENGSLTDYLPTHATGGDYGMYSYGNVILNSAPAIGDVLSWSGQPLLLCHFAEDRIDPAQMTFDLWNCGSIKMKTPKR